MRSQGLDLGAVGDVSDRLGEALAARDDRAIAVLTGSLHLNSAPLGAVLDDPRLRTAALADRSGDDAQLLGVVRVDAADRALAASLDAPDLLSLVRGLQAAGTPVTPVPLTGYVWADPAGEADALAAADAVAALDERRVRLREAARGGDGFYSTVVLRRLSWRCTDLALRLRLTPNAVTLLSLGIGLLAAGLVATGERAGMVAGAVLLQLCLVIDCVDGELARYRRRFSRFGAWLDATTDRVKEFAVIAALAGAAWRQGHDVWWLAALAVGVQTFRNLFEVAWAIQREYVNPPVVRPVRWVPVAERFIANPVARPDPGFGWLKRLGHFPVGERFLLISLGAALWTPPGTLVALVAAGLASTAYMLAAFAVRARSSDRPAPRLLAMLDLGPLPARRAELRATRSGARTPALMAVLELYLLWQLTRPAGGAALALVVAASIAHYQHVYGVRERASGSRRWTLGSLGRVVLAVAVALLGAPPALVWCLVGLVGLDTLLGAVHDWRVVAPGRPDHPGHPDHRPVPEVV